MLGLWWLKKWLDKELNLQTFPSIRCSLILSRFFLNVWELLCVCEAIIVKFSLAHWLIGLTIEKAKMFATSIKGVNPLYYLLLGLKALCWKLLSHLIHELFAKGCEQSVLCKAFEECLARSLACSFCPGWSCLKLILAYKWTSAD